MKTREELLGGLHHIRNQLIKIRVVTERQVGIVAAFREAEADITTEDVESKAGLAIIALSLAYALYLALLGYWIELIILAFCARVIYKNRNKSSKGKDLAVAVMLFDAAALLYHMLQTLMNGRIFQIIVMIPLVVFTFLAVRYFVVKKNAATNKKNAEIAQYNAELRAQYDDTVQQLGNLKRDLAAFGRGWYPVDYYSIETVSFFIKAIENFKADSMKEAVLLFDQTQYRQKMLESQRAIEQMNRQQLINQRMMNAQLGFANLLNMQNLALREDELNAINRNTAAVQKHTDAVDQAGSKIKDAINRLR